VIRAVIIWPAEVNTEEKSKLWALECSDVASDKGHYFLSLCNSCKSAVMSLAPVSLLKPSVKSTNPVLGRFLANMQKIFPGMDSLFCPSAPWQEGGCVLMLDCPDIGNFKFTFDKSFGHIN
jgi:hypothetical protein